MKVLLLVQGWIDSHFKSCKHFNIQTFKHNLERELQFENENNQKKEG